MTTRYTLLAIVVCMALGPASAEAGVRAMAGTTTGGIGLDAGLADYRWDTRPSFVWGARLDAERGRLGVGLRVWRSHTTQASGIPGETLAPRVNLTGAEVNARLLAAGYRGFELWGGLSAGRLMLRYDPDRTTFNVAGVGDIDVEYRPIDEWTYGARAEVRRRIPGGILVALNGAATGFSLDTAHRRGEEIVESRERFVNWTLSIDLLLPLG